MEENAKRERKKIMLDMADKFEKSVQGIVHTVAAASTELSPTPISLIPEEYLSTHGVPLC
jgi:hypothetical protein